MKKFIIIGNGGAVTYESIFPLVKEDKMWLGASKGICGKFYFLAGENYENKHNLYIDGKKVAQVNNACWWTNVDFSKRHTPLDLYKRYSNEYPKFDTFDAINVDKTVEIPMDYNGVMGVPISFLDKYCPEQFEIVGKLNHNRPQSYDFGKSIVNGKEIYARILIRKRTA